MMLQHDTPEDFVVSTDETHSVQEFLEGVFGILDLDWEAHVEIDPRYFRPAEVDFLLGDSSKARKVLGWEPEVDFPGLVKMMTDADMKLAEREKVLADAGHFHRTI